MSNRLNPNIGPTASPGRFAERVCCAGRLQAIGNDGAGQAESKSQCSHRPLLLRSLPPVIVPNGIPAVSVSGFNPKIPMTENCVSFGFPIYRDEKIARVLLSRYIGTGKLREFWRPDISALQNCLRDRSETVPETVSEILWVANYKFGQIPSFFSVRFICFQVWKREYERGKHSEYK